MLKLYETHHLRISYEPRLRLLEVLWLTDVATPAEFREGYWQALLLAERHQTRAWLSDFRSVPTPPEEEVQWLTQHWYPRYVQLKLDKVAIIKPLSPGAQQALARIVQLANEAGHTNRPDAHYFDDPAAARAWIEQPFTRGQLPPAG
ncbi:hypothetical protein [Hymenobacter edaphi]|uniref:STAS/SEC14 domain-containing protein n=1 Tax=Hymenobacter edaphi TaxID=2211146 RepID=A0A328B5Q4_9BACT|nr:hypothetical protein [Hymenobacter edaphi]RAK62700.1 hypothetical protein DLM85_22805 [Hymenobacter edaphi]